MNITKLCACIALAPCLLLASAGSDLGQVHPVRPQQVGVLYLPLTVVDVPIGNQGESESLFLITTQAQFQQLFGEEAVGIDFNQDWAFFYSAGVLPTGGYEATVEDVAYTPDVMSLVITTSLVTPGMNCPVAQHLTMPHVVVKFPKPRPVGVVRIQKDDMVLDCGR